MCLIVAESSAMSSSCSLLTVTVRAVAQSDAVNVSWEGLTVTSLEPDLDI